MEDWTRVLYNLCDPAPNIQILPVLSLSAFIYKIGPGSHKQSNAEHTRSPAVVVASSLAVANGSASVEVDAHGVEKAEDSQKCENSSDPKRSRGRVLSKVEKSSGNGSNVNRVLNLDTERQ